MAKFEVLETYNSEIEKLEPTTPGHADVFNAIFQQLINNDAFIKKVAEQQLTIIQSHLNNENEPHQKVFDTYYRQLVNYTDKAIADLINGAPETADTLRELADLIDKNKDVTTALNEAIGKKANQTELDQAISDINTLNSGLMLRPIYPLYTGKTAVSGTRDVPYEVTEDGYIQFWYQVDDDKNNSNCGIACYIDGTIVHEYFEYHQAGAANENYSALFPVLKGQTAQFHIITDSVTQSAMIYHYPARV